MQDGKGTSYEQSTKRTGIACRRCNQKKVKCIAPAGPPCNGCRFVQSDCVLIDSQRGRYPRTKARSKTVLRSPNDQNEVANQASGKTISNTGTPLSPPLAENDSPDMLYARIAEEGVSEHQQPVSDASQSVFLGEAFSLTYVVHDVLAQFMTANAAHQRRLHFPLTVPPAGFGGTLSPYQIAVRQAEYLHTAEIAYMPQAEVLHRLLDTYLDAFHPAFPVLDQTYLLETVKSKEVSLLILNAVCMVAVTLCDDDLLSSIGAKDRYAARSVFYQQTKALYDADLEPNKLSNVIGVFLMSFWWSGPDDQKDSWHWLGIAASLAQSMGMHRSTSCSGVEPQTSRIWRRLWWAIRTRDVLVSGSIGRPQHISDLDCDVEPTIIDDIKEVMPAATDEKAMYATEMAKLAPIFSKIITCRYTPAGASGSRSQLESLLVSFRRSIPSPLHYNGIEAKGDGLWSAMLILALNYATILLCRPERRTGVREEDQQWGNTDMARTAANEVSRVMEDILTASLGRKCQIHCIPAMFNALAIHISTICQTETMQRELTQNRAKVCMLGLAVLRDSWPVGGWVYHLFASIMQRLQSKPQVQRASGSRTPPSSSSIQNDVTDMVDQQVARQGWQSEQTWNDNVDNSMTSRQHHENIWTDFVAGSHVPDIFALGDTALSAAGDESAFFNLLDLPAWPEFR